MNSRNVLLIGGVAAVTTLVAGYWLSSSSSSNNTTITSTEGDDQQQAKTKQSINAAQIEKEYNAAIQGNYITMTVFFNKYTKLLENNPNCYSYLSKIVLKIFDEYEYSRKMSGPVGITLLNSDILFSLSRYIQYHLVHKPTEYGEELPTACQLSNEIIFLLDSQKLQNPRIKKGLYSFLNLVPWMFYFGSTDAMYRQTCCNALSFLALNKTFVTPDIWDKVTHKSMEFNSVETLVGTQARLSSQVDSLSETSVRSCLVTLGHMATGRPEVHKRIRETVLMLDDKSRNTLFAAWKKHGTQAHALIKVYAVYLLKLFENELSTQPEYQELLGN
jgi:hypothetical protein